MKSKSKGFYRCISSKRNIGKMRPLLNWVGALLTTGMEMARVFNAFFTLVFTVTTCLQESQAPHSHEKVGSSEDLTLGRKIRLGNIR